MELEKNKTIYNDKLVQYSKKHLIYNGDIKNFKQHIYNNDEDLISVITHFIIYYDSNNKIVHAENLESIPKLQETNDFKFNIFKWIYTIRQNKKRQDRGVTSKYEKLKKDLPRKIFDTNESIKVLCLEISKETKRYRGIVNELKEELEVFLHPNTIKYEHYINETLGSFFGMKLFVMVYLSILIATVIKITAVIPLSLINDNEVLLTIKLVIGILLAIFSIFIVFVIIVIIIDAKSGLYTKYNLLFSSKMLVISSLLIYSVISILTSIYRNNTTQYFLIHNFAYNIYVDSKTSLVYDTYLHKPIIYLGSKDGVYYYNDSFNKEKLKNKLDKLHISKNNYNPILIKKVMLNIDQKDGDLFLNEPVKVENMKNMNFDYNNSLIINELFKS